jgi:tRNA-dihydrouridine synthase C
MLCPTTPAVVLAPMEGLTDAPMRAVLSAAGGFTFCVSEFVRVSHTVLGASVFRKRVPELPCGARTPAGLPVQVQLLGGDPGRMAESAANAVAAGATAIDLNFGCPAATVNKHDGGATLLKDPPRVRAVVRAVRDAVPADIPVSAKMRLGWDRTDTIFESSAMAAEGGASWITIHARTRMQCYAPPVNWELIGRVRERLRLPVVANGDIHTLADFRRCRDLTGCLHFMLGRGAVADPGLAGQVAKELGIVPQLVSQHSELTDSVCTLDPPVSPTREPGPLACAESWLGPRSRVGLTGGCGGDAPVADLISPFPHWPTLLPQLIAHTPAGDRTPAGTLKRLKQWLRVASACGTFAHFEHIKRATSVDELLAVVAAADRER